MVPKELINPNFQKLQNRGGNAGEHRIQTASDTADSNIFTREQSRTVTH